MNFRIDWNRGGFWRVRDEDGNTLGEFERILIDVPARLELAADNHGWLVCAGRLDTQGENQCRIAP
jgi:hypothetical protein